jgi:putative transposase
MTPDQVHFGQVDAVHAARQVALDRAFAAHPARFVNKAPVPFETYRRLDQPAYAESRA